LELTPADANVTFANKDKNFPHLTYQDYRRKGEQGR